MKFVVSIFVAFFALCQADQTRCPTDIVYLVDQSTSITQPIYKQDVIPFIKNTIRKLNVAQQGDHVGVIRFSSPDDTSVDFSFDYTFDPKVLADEIDQLTYSGGSTGTVQALQLAQNNVFGSSARKDAYGKTVAPVAVIITDGIATDGDAALEAKKLMNAGVNVFAIGVGPIVSKEYLMQIAGQESRVFYVHDINAFNDALIQVISSTTKC